MLLKGDSLLKTFGTEGIKSTLKLDRMIYQK